MDGEMSAWQYKGAVNGNCFGHRFVRGESQAQVPLSFIHEYYGHGSVGKRQLRLRQGSQEMQATCGCCSLLCPASFARVSLEEALI